MSHLTVPHPNCGFPPNWRRLGKSARDDQLVKLILDTASMVRHHNRKPTRGYKLTLAHCLA
jgi:hypothetical protein